MGLTIDDVDDCGILPGWIHRNLEILRQLDCRATVFDNEVRKAMLEVIKISTNKATATLLKKRQNLDDIQYQSRNFTSDLVQLDSTSEPLSKRCRYQSLKSRQILNDHSTQHDLHSSTFILNTASQTSPDVSTVSPKSYSQTESFDPLFHKLHFNRSSPSRTSPSSSTQCSDSPDSLVSSSPLTPTDQLPTEDALPFCGYISDKSSKRDHLTPLLPELISIDERHDEQLSITNESPFSHSGSFRRFSDEAPLELSAARYFLSRKRALLLQKLSLLRQGSLYVKQEHARLIQKYYHATQQASAPSQPNSPPPVESVSSGSARRLRSSVPSHNQTSQTVCRTVPCGLTTRSETQHQAISEINPTTEGRTRAESIHSSSGSNSGTSGMTGWRRRRSSMTVRHSQAAVASAESQQHMEVPTSTEKLTVAHRTQSSNIRRQSISTSTDSCLPCSQSTEQLQQTPNNDATNHNWYISDITKHSPHSDSYEPLSPSIHIPTPISSSDTTSLPDKIDQPSGLFHCVITDPSIGTIPHQSPPNFFDLNISPFHTPVSSSPLGTDPLAFFTAAYPISHRHPAALLHRPFGLYNPITLRLPPELENPTSIPFSTIGAISGQNPTQSHYPTTSTPLFHGNQYIGIPTHSALSSSDLNSTNISITKSAEGKSQHHQDGACFSTSITNATNSPMPTASPMPTEPNGCLRKPSSTHPSSSTDFGTCTSQFSTANSSISATLYDNNGSNFGPTIALSKSKKRAYSS